MASQNDQSPERTDSTRARILSAACQEFIERGYEGARVRRIAEISGANKALIYYYFGRKENLYRLVLKQVFLGAIRQVEDIFSSPEPFEKKTARLVSFYVALYGGNPGLVRIMLRELAGGAPVLLQVLNEAKVEIRDFGFQRIGFDRCLKEEIDRGKARDLDPRHTFVSLISMCAGYFILRPIVDTILGLDRSRSDLFGAERGKNVVDLLLNGILKR